MTSTPKFNNVTNAIVVVATAAGTTTLTASSAHGIVFTGSTTQTLVLPVVSTLSLGTTYQVFNNSSGIVTVQSSGLNTIQAMIQDTSLLITCIAISGTGTASWQALYVPIAPFAFPLSPSLGGTGSSSVPTNGQIPIGNGTTYTAAALTAGTGISITNGSGTITIASTDQGPDWSGVSGTTQAAVAGAGYVIQNAGQTTVTLPATAALGAMVAVQGLGAGGWVLTANTGQTIQVGSTATSSGGTITSANQWDSIEVVCVVANTTWSVTRVLSAGVTTA